MLLKYLINDLGIDKDVLTIVLVVIIYGLLMLYIVYTRYYVSNNVKRKVEEMTAYTDICFKELESYKIIDNDEEIIIYFNKNLDKDLGVICYYKHSHKVVIRCPNEIKIFQFKKKFRGAEHSYIEDAVKDLHYKYGAPWYKC